MGAAGRSLGLTTIRTETIEPLGLTVVVLRVPDTISLAEELPANLELGDLLYSPNIGAYSQASSTWFNGFPPAKVLHINQ